MPALFATTSAQAAQRGPPPAPALIQPANDPKANCLAIDEGIKLDWALAPAGYPTRSYLEVRRLDNESKWRPWVKTYANPPFTLQSDHKPMYMHAIFAWRVWSVDPTGQAKPYATASRWWAFCTKDDESQSGGG